jgi:hypothetical protein
MEIQELLAGKREVLRWDCSVSYNYDVRTIQFKPRMTFHVSNISAAPKDQIREILLFVLFDVHGSRLLSIHVN